jgi:hypothetical protein
MKQDLLARRVRFAAAGLGMLLGLAATGCGSYGSVSGKITCNGQPLGGGTVVFTVEGQGSDSSPIGPDGSYHINKVPTGTAKVSVETLSVKPAGADFRRPPNMPTPPAGQIPQGAQPLNYDTQPKGTYVEIPENYSDPNKSGLTYEVKSGSQEKSFDLQK